MQRSWLVSAGRGQTVWTARFWSRVAAVAVMCAGLWCAEAAAQFVAPGGIIPVVANLPGVNDTFWRSDVSILNVTESDTTVTLYLYPEIRGGTAAFEPMVSDPISLPASGQVTLANVVQSVFQQFNTKGALWISTGGTPVVLSSRTYTRGDDGGSYGQDVSSVLVTHTAWASGLEHDGFYRTNLGIFWPFNEAVTFQVTVYDSAGVEAGAGTIPFNEAGIQQYSFDAFGVGTLLDGYAVVRCSDSSSPWYAYASKVDQISGDAVFRIARSYQVLGKGRQ